MRVPFDFYPRSPCGERLSWCFRSQPGYRYFYPRSPCGERLIWSSGCSTVLAFLSTLSLRRATGAATLHFPPGRNFYPRSPCGERHHHQPPRQRDRYFYPRSPCGERRRCHALYRGDQRFLSTLSLRRATASPAAPVMTITISIHALLAESDIQVHILRTIATISIHALLAESDPACALC